MEQGGIHSDPHPPQSFSIPELKEEIDQLARGVRAEALSVVDSAIRDLKSTNPNSKAIRQLRQVRKGLTSRNIEKIRNRAKVLTRLKGISTEDVDAKLEEFDAKIAELASTAIKTEQAVSEHLSIEPNLSGVLDKLGMHHLLRKKGLRATIQKLIGKLKSAGHHEIAGDLAEVADQVPRWQLEQNVKRTRDNMFVLANGYETTEIPVIVKGGAYAATVKDKEISLPVSSEEIDEVADLHALLTQLEMKGTKIYDNSSSFTSEQIERYQTQCGEVDQLLRSLLTPTESYANTLAAEAGDSVPGIADDLEEIGEILDDAGGTLEQRASRAKERLQGIIPKMQKAKVPAEQIEEFKVKLFQLNLIESDPARYAKRANRLRMRIGVAIAKARVSRRTLAVPGRISRKVGRKAEARQLRKSCKRWEAIIRSSDKQVADHLGETRKPSGSKTVLESLLEREKQLEQVAIGLAVLKPPGDLRRPEDPVLAECSRSAKMHLRQGEIGKVIDDLVQASKRAHVLNPQLDQAMEHGEVQMPQVVMYNGAIRGIQSAKTGCEQTGIQDTIRLLETYCHAKIEDARFEVANSLTFANTASDVAALLHAIDQTVSETEAYFAEHQGEIEGSVAFQELDVAWSGFTEQLGGALSELGEVDDVTTDSLKSLFAQLQTLQGQASKLYDDHRRAAGEEVASPSVTPDEAAERPKLTRRSSFLEERGIRFKGGKLQGLKGMEAKDLQDRLGVLLDVIGGAEAEEFEEIAGAVGEVLRKLGKREEVDAKSLAYLRERVDALGEALLPDAEQQRAALAVIQRQITSLDININWNSWMERATDPQAGAFDRMDMIDKMRQALIENSAKGEGVQEARIATLEDVRSALLDQMAEELRSVSIEEYLSVDTSQFHDKKEVDPGKEGSFGEVVNNAGERATMASLSIAREILTRGSPEERARLLERYIDLGDRLVKAGSFPDVIGIFFGLIAAPVSRLDKSWEAISPEHKSRWEGLRSMSNPVGGFKAMQREYASRLAKGEVAIPPLPILANQITVVLENPPGKAGELPLSIQSLTGSSRAWFSDLRSKVFEAVLEAQNTEWVDDDFMWEGVYRLLASGYVAETGEAELPQGFEEAVDSAIAEGRGFMAAMAKVVTPVRAYQSRLLEEPQVGKNAGRVVDTLAQKGAQLKKELGAADKSRQEVQDAFDKFGHALSKALE